VRIIQVQRLGKKISKVSGLVALKCNGESTFEKAHHLAIQRQRTLPHHPPPPICHLLVPLPLSLRVLQGAAKEEESLRCWVPRNGLLEEKGGACVLLGRAFD
jgi:hypothetical protein